MNEEKDLIQAVQDEVARVREMIAETKALLPNGNVNFAFYELTIDEAELAIKYQDPVKLVKVLPELKGM